MSRIDIGKYNFKLPAQAELEYNAVRVHYDSFHTSSSEICGVEIDIASEEVPTALTQALAQARLKMHDISAHVVAGETNNIHGLGFEVVDGSKLILGNVSRDEFCSILSILKVTEPEITGILNFIDGVAPRNLVSETLPTQRVV